MAVNPRIVFMGTPEFAVATLQAILNVDFNVVGVITAPDKPAGRGKKIQQPAVKTFALAHGLNILQPTNLKDPEFVQNLKDLNADLQIVVAFRMLPEVVWAMPKMGTINLHASLLPNYRGAAPINWAIINGEKETGVTTFFIQKEIDTGNILFQETITIHDNMTAGELHDKLMEMGAELMVKTIHAVTENSYTEKKQDTLLAGKKPKLAPKIFREDCQINWDRECKAIYNLIRGLNPYPSAWSEMRTDNEDYLLFKIYNANYETTISSEKPGYIISDGKNYLKVACKDGLLNITELQPAGKKRMAVKDFLRGFNTLDQYKSFV